MAWHGEAGMEIEEACRQYQRALEAHRVDPDDDTVWGELQRAQDTLNVLWVHYQAEQALTQPRPL